MYFTLAGGITGSGSVTNSYFDSGITIIGKNNAQGVNVSGLTDSLIGTNYKMAKIDASDTVNVFADISPGEPPDQRVWTYTEPDQAKNPRLKHLYKNKNLSIAQTGDTLTANLGDSEFLDVTPTGLTYQWYSDGKAIGSATSASYKLTSAEAGKRVYVTLTADNYVAEMYSNFTKPYGISIDAGIQNGTISANPMTAAEGVEVTVTVEPGEGYQLVKDSLKANGEEITLNSVDGEPNKYTFTMPAKDVSITASFEKVTYEIKDNSGDYGSVGIKGTPQIGETITLTVKPDEGYQLKENTLKATADGKEIDLNAVKDEPNQYTFTMPANDVSIDATFEKATYKITDKSGENGSVSFSGTPQIDETITLTVEPEDGYRLKEKSLKANDGEIELTQDDKNPSEYTFIMPAKDVTITADFEPKTTPTVGDFDFKLDPAIYDGQAKSVDVNGEDLGNITVSYQQNGVTASPIDAGEYDVLVSTTGSAKWNPVTNLSLGKLEIEPCEIKNASVTIPAVLQDSSDTLEDQTLTISSDSIAAGDAVKATCDVSFDSGTDKVGAFDTATVTVKTIDNPNYSLSGELKGQSYEVIAKTLQSIAISQVPNKLTYFVGDIFDPTGMEVTATYDSGDVVLGPGDYQITPDGPLTLGTAEVTISFGEQKVKQKIEVKAVELESISITTKPSKVDYYAGESFDASGLVIKRTYNNGKEDTLAYAGAQTEFSFKPTLTTPLTTENTSVEIGYGGKTTTLAINVEPKPVDTYSLSGTVVGEGNVGLVGAKVTLSGVKNLFTTTGEGGSFKLEQIPAGEYTLLVEADGYQERSQKLVVSGDQQDLAVTLEKRPEDTFTLTVRATTTDDKPLAGASVSVQGQDTKTTDAEGRVSFDKLKAGTYSVKVSCDGYNDKAEDVKVVNEDISLHLALEAVAPPEYKVSGIITDSETKQALIGVEVTCGNKTALSDDKGVYTIEGLVAGQYVLTAKAGGYPDTQIGFEIAAGDVQVDLALKKAAPATYSLNGKVLDQSNQPLEKVELTLTKGKAAPLTTQSDENGEYRFTDLENGTYTLTIDQEGYAPYLKEVKIEGLSRQQDIHLQKNRFPIAGNITGPDKAPIPNAGIKLVDGQGDVLAEVTTDDQGHFILGDIPNGNYLLVVSAAGYEEHQTQITVNGNPITTALALDLLTYSITDESGANGAIEISGKGQAGETITLKVKPDAGYRLVENSLAVNAGAIALTPVDDYYTFIMPGEDVRITASFEAIPNHDATQTPGTIGRGADAVFKFNGDLSALLDVTLIHEDGSEYPFVLPPEGELIRLTHDNESSGKAESGSVIVTLYADWLANLPGGRYTLVLGFADGSERGMGSGDFVLTGEPKTEPAPAPVTPAKPQNPSTGDPRADVLTLLALALIGAAGALWSGRRRRV